MKMAQRRSRRTAAAAAESRMARAFEDESEDSNGSNYGADNNSVSSSDNEARKKVVEETITEFPKEKIVCDMCEETFWHWRWLQSHMWDAHAKIYRPDWAEPMPSTSKPNDKKVDEQKKKKKLLPPPPNPKPTKKISRKKSLDDVRHVSQLEDLQSFTTKNRKKSIHSSSYVNTSSKHA